MAKIPVDIKGNIDKLYDKQKDTQLQRLRNSQKKAVGEINSQKKVTDQQYYDKRNQSDVVNMQNQRALAERMASIGQTGANVSGQIALQAARQNTLGDLNEQEQGIMNAYDRQIADINDPSKEQGIVDQIESQRSQQLAEALERAIERQRQQEQFEQQLAWEREKFNRSMASRGSGGGGSRGGRRSSGGSGEVDWLELMQGSGRVVSAKDADKALNMESVNRGQMDDYAAMAAARGRSVPTTRRTTRLGGPQMLP